MLHAWTLFSQEMYRSEVVCKLHYRKIELYGYLRPELLAPTSRTVKPLVDENPHHGRKGRKDFWCTSGLGRIHLHGKEYVKRSEFGCFMSLIISTSCKLSINK